MESVVYAGMDERAGHHRPGNVSSGRRERAAETAVKHEDAKLRTEEVPVDDLTSARVITGGVVVGIQRGKVNFIGYEGRVEK